MIKLCKCLWNFLFVPVENKAGSFQLMGRVIIEITLQRKV